MKSLPLISVPMLPEVHVDSPQSFVSDYQWFLEQNHRSMSHVPGSPPLHEASPWREGDTIPWARR
jgi:hypothetical protein